MEKILITADYAGETGAGMFLGNLPLLRSLTIDNENGSDLSDLKIRIYSEPSFFSEIIEDIPYLPSGRSADLGEIIPQPDMEFLLSLKEMKSAEIKVEVLSEETDTVTTLPVSLVPVRFWTGCDDFPELTAGFSDPSDPAVEKIYSAAVRKYEIRHKGMELHGYLTGESKVIESEAIKDFIESIYESIDELNIRFLIPPDNFAVNGQYVRTPEEITEEKYADCLDIACLFLSVIERAGLNGAAVFTEDHVFTAVFLKDETMRDTVSYELNEILRKAAGEESSFFIFDPAHAMAGVEESFPKRGNEVPDTIAGGKFICAVDIKKARESEIPSFSEKDTEDKDRDRDTELKDVSDNLKDTLPASSVITDNFSAPLSQTEGNEYTGTEDNEVEDGGSGKKDIGNKDKNKYSDETETVTEARTESKSETKSDTKYGEGNGDEKSGTGENGSSGNVESDTPQERSEIKKRMWERKLLDISPRVSLISLKMTKNNMQLVSPKLYKLNDALFEGKTIRILKRPEEWDNLISDLDKNPGRELSMFRDHAEEEFKNYSIRTLLSSGELETRGNAMVKNAAVTLQENGANSLFMVLGLLKYISGKDDKERFAPLIMIPVEAEGRITGEGFNIRMRDEDPVFNAALLEMLRQEYSMEIPGLDPLPLTSEGKPDLTEVFTRVKDAVSGEKDWDIREEAVAGLFSFSRFVMWKDIRESLPEFRKNEVVESLVQGKLTYIPEKIEEDFMFTDDSPLMDKIIFPISSDSSQTEAVMAASEGKSFVLHGPPGTGKSQTITNIIANALLEGKRVLFCAQKMAALEVVARRLKSIGIGSFCIELHSAKSKKKEVLSQLESSMKITKISKPINYEEEKRNLKNRKDELNGIVRALYTKDETGYSIYDLLSSFSKLNDFNKYLVLKDDFDPSHLREKEEALSSLISSGRSAGGPYMHPLKGITIGIYSPGMRQRIEDILSADFEAVGKTLANLTGEESNKLRELKDVLSLQEFIENSSPLRNMEERVFNLSNITSAPGELYSIAEKITLLSEKKENILKEFSEDVLKLDADELKKEYEEGEDKFIFTRILSKNPALKELSDLSKSRIIKKEEVPGIIDTLRSFSDLKNETVRDIGSKNEILKNTLGKGTDSDPTEIKHLADVISEFLQKTDSSELDFYNNLALRNSFSSDSEKFSEEFLKLRDFLNEFQELTGFENPSDSSGYFEVLTEKKEDMLSSLDTLRDYISYQKAKKDAGDIGLSEFTEIYEKGEVREDELLPAFRKSIYRSLLIKRLGENRELLSLTGNTLEEKIKELSKLEEEMRLTSSKLLYHTLASKVPGLVLDPAASMELAVLQKAIKRGSQKLSLRKLFKDTDRLLSKIAPCMLMSPLSAAQYLKAEHGMFDLVIFDEASQIPTPEAIGALGRGKQVIIAGDPKQLPPTSFFVSQFSTDDNGNFEEEDLDNILDECLSLSMPESYLLWHYRSRHESLIAFSNRNFYDNMLYTYPSPDDRISRVKYIKNDSIYDRGGTRTNRGEAEEIITEVIRRVNDPLLSKESMGIITFSSAQETLIEEILRGEIKKDETLEEKFLNLPEPFFIKNLENVQGDERDVILFSIGYGTDGDGRISMNFGPLNNEGGWRRLNVAVSRAKKEMLVFTNIEPSAMHVSRESARGVIELRNFLQFAKGERIGMTPEELRRGKDEEGLSSVIAERLREEGLKTETGIGASRFRLDLAVADPEDPGKYILGIMCGGKSYRDSKSAYDREILQKSVLEGLGWTIHRVYPLDFMENEDCEIKKILEIIETLKRRKRNDSENKGQNGLILNESGTESEDSSVNQDNNPSDNKPGVYEEIYRMNTLPVKEMPYDEFLKVSNSDGILKDLMEIIKSESPISLNLLTKRIREKYSLKRISEKTENHIEMILNKERPPVTIERGLRIYWDKDPGDNKLMYFRRTLPEDKTRLLTETAQTEIMNSVLFILSEENFSEKALVRKVSEMMGYTGLNVENQKYIEEILSSMYMDGKIIKTPEGLTGIKSSNE